MKLVFVSVVSALGFGLARAGELSKCALINIQENENQNIFDESSILLGASDKTEYVAEDSDSGWNIKCRADKEVDFFQFTWEDGTVVTDYSACVDGSSSTRTVNKKIDVLSSQCGDTTVKVAAHTISGGDKTPAATKSFTLNGKPEPFAFWRCHLCRRCKSMRYHTTGTFPIPFPATPELVVMNRKGEIVVNATMAHIRYRPGKDFVDQSWPGYSDHVADVEDNGVYMRSKNDCGVSEWRKCSVNSPIALDLDMSGAVEHIYGNFDFDLSGNGIPEHLTEWFAPTEGILVDSTHPGFDDGKLIGWHLYGDVGGVYDDGFDKLALHDKNNDGFVSGDDEMEGIAIWIDANSNAVLDDGELSSLADHGVVSLTLAHDEHYISTATLADGSTMVTQDKWFAR